MAKKTQQSTAVATPVASGVALPADLPEFMRDKIAQDAGAGTSQNARDVVVPFLQIIQSNSPQVKRQHEKYIAGAEAGMILNTATGQLHDAAYEEGRESGVLFVPCYYSRAEVEWILRSEGGGFVAHHAPDTPLLRDIVVEEDSEGKRVRMLPNGHQLVETVYHFGIELASGEPAIIAMTSTGLTVSRQWMALRNQFKVSTPNGPQPAPSFSRVYRICTAWRQKDNNDWWTYKILDAGWLTDASLYQKGRMIHQQGQRGELQLGAPPSDSAELASLPGAKDDDSIPV